MGWISGSIRKYSTIEEVEDAWDNTYSQLPMRTADENELVFIGSFISEDEARKRLEKTRTVGMSYAEVRSFSKEPARLRDAKALLNKEKKKLADFLVESSIYRSHTGRTVGCKSCGSSFPVEYFRVNTDKYIYPYIDYKSPPRYVNTCPVCGKEMRSATALSRIDGYRKNIGKYEERVRDIEKETPNRSYYLGVTNAYLG